MLCIIFGITVALITWGQLGNWSALVGVGATIGLYLTMKFWPTESSR